MREAHGIHIGKQARNLAYVFYMMCDTSSSMFWEPEDQARHKLSPGELLQSTIHQMISALAKDPEVRDLGHISIMTFNDELQVALQLTKLADCQARLPPLTRGTFTDYHKAWSEFGKIYAKDLSGLCSRGVTIYRPVIFFVTDGVPETAEGWQAEDVWIDAYEDAFSRVDEKWKPRIIAMGFDKANEETLLKIHSEYPRHGRALLAEQVNEAAAFIPSLVGAIQNSMSTSMSSGVFRFKPPASMKDLCQSAGCPLGN